MIMIQPGHEFGRWIAIKRVENRSKMQCWLFRCSDCNEEHTAVLRYVNEGREVYCKCYRTRKLAELNIQVIKRA